MTYSSSYVFPLSSGTAPTLILNVGAVLSIVVTVPLFILFPARSVTNPFSLYVTSNVVFSGIEESAKWTEK